MSKIARVRLVGIRYEGESIGDDIRIEINHREGVFSLNKQIKHGTEAKVDAEVCALAVERSDALILDIKVVERDIIFQDVGGGSLEVKAGSLEESERIETCKIEVRESRGALSGGALARFTLSFAVSASLPIRYIPLIHDGWFKCYVGSTKEQISVVAYTKVRLDALKKGRQYIVPLEGPYIGQLLSNTADRDASSALLVQDPQAGSVQAVYSISKKKLTVDQKTYETTDDARSPWVKGIYDIEIPDHPHRSGHIYGYNSDYSIVWFRIGHQGDRYVHTGKHSLGCITMTETGNWDALCKLMLAGRKGDGRSVGTLTVTD